MSGKFHLLINMKLTDKKKCYSCNILTFPFEIKYLYKIVRNYLQTNNIKKKKHRLPGVRFESTFSNLKHIFKTIWVS